MDDNQSEKPAGHYLSEKDFDAKAGNITLDEYSGRGFLEDDPEAAPRKLKGEIRVPAGALTDISAGQLGSPEERRRWVYTGPVRRGSTTLVEEVEVWTSSYHASPHVSDGMIVQARIVEARPRVPEATS